MSWITWLDNRIQSVCRGMLRVCSVKLTASVMFTNFDHIVVEFSGPPIWASDSFYDPANPSAITVPPELGGRYFLHATLKWTLASHADFTEVQSNLGHFYALFEHKKNGNSIELLSTFNATAPVPRAALTTQVIVWEGDLDSGDSLELHAFEYASRVDTETSYSPILLDAYVCVRRLGEAG